VAAGNSEVQALLK